MKGKKDLIAIQSQLRKGAVPWPDESKNHEFAMFSRQLKELVFQNLPALGPSYAHRLSSESWQHDTDSQEFAFTVEVGFNLEVEGVTKRCTLSTMFTIDCNSLKHDAVLAIEMLNDDIDKWRKAVHQARDLQLKHVLATEGQEAFLAAVERSS